MYPLKRADLTLFLVEPYDLAGGEESSPAGRLCRGQAPLLADKGPRWRGLEQQGMRAENRAPGHRGFALKEKLVAYLPAGGIRWSMWGLTASIQATIYPDFLIPLA
jgi:hypothetical protein